MGGKSSGGGAGDMLAYGNKALALQEKIYNENKDLIQPYYKAGTTGLDELMMRLGLSGNQQANTAQSRQSLIDKYTPQFTSTNSVASNFLVGPDGKVYDMNAPYMERGAGGRPLSQLDWKSRGFKSMGTTSSTVDSSGLNSYVDKILGEQAAATQSAIDNPLYGSLLDTYTGQDIYNDPSYKFRFDQGQKAAERALAASGKYLAPAGIQALQQYGQEMGSQEYGNAYNRFVNDQTNIYNRLANIAGLGQTATGQLAGVGTNYANAGTELYTGMGNAITAANQAKAANKSSMFGQLLGTAGQIGMAYFSDERLKTNIAPIGQENGHDVYEFSYRGDDSGKRYIGVLAQEVMATNPDAVTEVEGFLAVNYDKIGVKFREADRAA